jgi:GNAT superfamily N-acetyltransferase
LEIVALTAADIGDNVALARAVGWQDAESDWRVLHDAAVVLGIRRQGVLVAQGALGTYGHAGTIAKMVILPDWQRRGLATKLLAALLEEAQRRSIDVLGLVATPSGRPLYEQHQFVHAGDVVVYTGAPATEKLVIDESETRCEAVLDIGAAVAVDEEWLACSRARMLDARLREAVAKAALIATSRDGQARGSALRGYAIATAQGASCVVGPVVAPNAEDAAVLASSIFRAVARPVRIDVPAEQETFRKWLRSVGLEELGSRPEMARGAPRLPWQVPQRFALATQAWG